MDEDVEKVTEMQDMINRGEYRVEPAAVADAILRSLRELAAARGERVAPQERAWANEHPVRWSARIPTARPACH